MDGLGRAVGDGLGGIGDALSGLMSGVTGAFSAALRHLAEIVPGGVVSVAVVIGIALVGGWLLLRRG
jgi:hypothetical protein